jgi:GTPase SAR1 family protein
VYDVTEPESFKNIQGWLQEITRHASEGVNRLLVGNKSDAEDRKKVSTEEGTALANQIGIKFLETSAKSSQNVEQAFVTMASEIKSKVATSTTKTATRGDRLTQSKSVATKKKGCCG